LLLWYWLGSLGRNLTFGCTAPITRWRGLAWCPSCSHRMGWCGMNSLRLSGCISLCRGMACLLPFWKTTTRREEILRYCGMFGSSSSARTLAVNSPCQTPELWPYRRVPGVWVGVLRCHFLTAEPHQPSCRGSRAASVVAARDHFSAPACRPATKRRGFMICSRTIP